VAGVIIGYDGDDIILGNRRTSLRDHYNNDDDEDGMYCIPKRNINSSIFYEIIV